MNVDDFVSLLDKVKSTGQGKWQACCPAHDDRNPSMGIKEGDNGTILVHCWSGCTIHQITAALGIQVSDLFPDNIHNKRLSFMQKQRAITKARTKADERKRALEAIKDASRAIVAIMDVVDDMVEGRQPTERTRRFLDARALELLAADAKIRGF